MPVGKIQAPLIFVKKVLLEHSHAHLFVYILSRTAFALQWQNEVVGSETVWPVILKNIFSLAFYRKSFLISSLRESSLSKI